MADRSQEQGARTKETGQQQQPRHRQPGYLSTCLPGLLLIANCCRWFPSLLLALSMLQWLLQGAPICMCVCVCVAKRKGVVVHTHVLNRPVSASVCVHVFVGLYWALLSTRRRHRCVYSKNASFNL